MKINKLHKVAPGLVLALGLSALTGCSDQFLAEKQPYGKFGPDLVYGDANSIRLRLNYLYEKSLPYYKGYANTTDNFYPDLWPIGLPDMLSANTDEFTGYGEYTKPGTIWSSENIQKFFYYGVNESPWKKIRECNDVITRVNESTALTDLEKHETEAQARFFRATRYYRLWKRYGGVPIVDKLLSTMFTDSLQQAAVRNSSDETFRFMIDDLTYAGENLPARWEEEVNDWGRITSGASYALAGIIANYYASPVFNRADDTDRWQEAYDLNKKALEVLEEGKFGLAFEGDPGNNASNWANIWNSVYCGEGEGGLSEGVYIAICNRSAADKALNNCWEQTIRPSNAKGGGGLSPTSELVDAFPMADGKRPNLGSVYPYDRVCFFLNRDPRFYRTFAFPGTEWKFDGTIEVEEGDESYPYTSGAQYKLYNFAWYPDATEASNERKGGFFTDYMGNGGKTVFVRKKSQDAGLGKAAMYTFQNDGGFKYSGQPLIAIRYTEVLLNFAEAACGINKLDEAWNALVRIRQRVGYEGDCGLDPAIKGDRAKMFEAILYERRIELAYEGKRFDDCHRWMLFDGGEGQELINAGWGLTAWGGNTCTYLGVTPLKDQLLHRIELYFDPAVYSAAKENLHDPFTHDSLGIKKPTALSLKEDMTATVSEDTEEGTTYVYANSNVKKLAEFYRANLLRKDVETMDPVELKDADGLVVATFTMPTWDAKLYFMGLNLTDQENNPRVAQNIGWVSRYGGMGLFDPLSLTPNTDVMNVTTTQVVTPLE